MSNLTVGEAVSNLFIWASTLTIGNLVSVFIILAIWGIVGCGILWAFGLFVGGK